MDDSALQLGEAALDEAGADDALRANIELSASTFAVMGGDGTALRHADAAVRHAEAAGRPFLLSQALSNIAFLRHCAGGGVQRELLLRADALERAESVPGRDDTPLEVLGMQLYVNGDLAESRELLTAELERAQRSRLSRARELRDAAARRARGPRGALAARGRLRAADARAHARERPVERRGGRSLHRAVVDAHLGRVASAREHAETGRRQATDLGDLAFATKCSHVLGFLALSLGDPEGAVFHLAPLRANEERLNLREPAFFCIGPDTAEALVLAGDLDAARAVQAELEARGRELGRAWAIATGLRCRGLIAAVEGRSDDALAALHEAIAVHAEVPQPFDRARTLLVLGSSQRRFKQRAEARGSLEAALAVFEELGAALWAERARAEIARLGGRRARDRDELTETERRIAELAAGGRSNREIAGELFVSERTVESNLTRAYRKLGVRSRTELARRLPAE